MQPCPTCGRTEVDAAGYCPGCGTYRGTPGYDTGGQYGHQTSAPPYGGPANAPYGGPSSGAPYGGPSSGAPYQQPQPQQPYGYTDPNYTPSFVSPPATGRRPSTVPLIVLSVVAVILVVGIVGVVIARSGNGGSGTDDPTTGSTAGATNTVAAGIDTCVVGTWRIASAREKVEFEGSLVEFTASGGSYEYRGDGTGTIDYGSGVVYRGTVSSQSVTITLTGSTKFSYKTVDKTVTYSNESASGEAVLRINGAVTTSVPLDLDLKPDSYTCSGSSLTLNTDLATTELRK